MRRLGEHEKIRGFGRRMHGVSLAVWIWCCQFPTTEMPAKSSRPEKEGKLEWAAHGSVKNETVLPSPVRVTWGSVVVMVQGASETFRAYQWSEAHPVKLERTGMSSGASWERSPMQTWLPRDSPNSHEASTHGTWIGEGSGVRPLTGPWHESWVEGRQFSFLLLWTYHRSWV